MVNGEHDLCLGQFNISNDSLYYVKFKVLVFNTSLRLSMFPFGPLYIIVLPFVYLHLSGVPSGVKNHSGIIFLVFSR